MTAPAIIALWFAASIPASLLAGRFMAPRLHDVKDPQASDHDPEIARAVPRARSIEQFHDEGNAA